MLGGCEPPVGLGQSTGGGPGSSTVFLIHTCDTHNSISNEIMKFMALTYCFEKRCIVIKKILFILYYQF